MLYMSDILAIRFQKVLNDTRQEYPDLLDSQILGVLELMKYSLIITRLEELEEDDDQYENSETD